MNPNNYVIIKDENYVHVTHVLQVLHHWGFTQAAANIAVDTIHKSLRFDQLLKDEPLLINVDAEQWKELTEQARIEYKEKWAGLSEIGQIVHALNADYLRLAKGRWDIPLQLVPPIDEIKNPYYAFAKFGLEYDVKPIAIEQSVHHTIKHNGIILRCAGRLDLLADIKAPTWRKHKRYVLDYKISPRIYPEDIIQVAVYRWFYMKMTGTHIDGAANLRLDRDKIKYQFKPYTKARLRWAYSRFIDLLSYWIKTNERRP